MLQVDKVTSAWDGAMMTLSNKSQRTRTNHNSNSKLTKTNKPWQETRITCSKKRKRRKRSHQVPSHQSRCTMHQVDRVTSVSDGVTMNLNLKNQGVRVNNRWQQDLVVAAIIKLQAPALVLSHQWEYATHLAADQTSHSDNTPCLFMCSVNFKKV